MRIKLFLSVMFICGMLQSQTKTDLKDFINKNNVAIRTVQKTMVRDNNSAYLDSFKELIKNQEVAIKLFETKNDQCFRFAFLVRNECIEFLKKYTKGSVEYFELTESEKMILKTGSENNSKFLTQKEIKTIDDLDLMNLQNLNNLILTIQ